MDRTEIVNCAGPEHLKFEALASAGELPSAAHKAWHAGTKSGIEPLNKGSIDFAGVKLREANERINLLPATKSQARINGGEFAPLWLLTT